MVLPVAARAQRGERKRSRRRRTVELRDIADYLGTTPRPCRAVWPSSDNTKAGRLRFDLRRRLHRTRFESASDWVVVSEGWPAGQRGPMPGEGVRALIERICPDRIRTARRNPRQQKHPAPAPTVDHKSRGWHHPRTDCNETRKRPSVFVSSAPSSASLKRSIPQIARPAPIDRGALVLPISARPGRDQGWRAAVPGHRLWRPARSMIPLFEKHAARWGHTQNGGQPTRAYPTLGRGQQVDRLQRRMHAADGCCEKGLHPGGNILRQA